MRKIVSIVANEKVRWSGSEFWWNGASERLRRQGNEFWVSFREWREPVKQIGAVALGWMSSVLHTIAIPGGSPRSYDLSSTILRVARAS
jgi:hypothetical protein